ncbi:MAG: AMP-binding protein [Selenomonas sp.]|uniref:AMP-binding protein n=1 Tax=Selenomonas sp. TaxID=2053611 RepID=UPI0025F36A87|nr:AMP-binding protein [Selenomonas sp.]MCI6099221.1 AMP-binding protein [Selenomonas sp.]MCI6232213.1 AMP-binding protein [Selenomonas sp.]
MNYYDLLQQQVKTHPDKLFFVVDHAEYTYAAFQKLADELADDMTGIRPGDDVLLLADTPSLQLAAFLALQHLGARPILAHKDMGAELDDVQRENDLQGLVQVTETENADAPTVSFTPTNLPQQPHAERDILGVLSSGSTGTPKVMYRTYDSWAGFFPTQDEIFSVGEDTVMFLHGSLSFTGNTNSLLSVLYEGGTVVTSRHMRSHRWAKLLHQYDVNCIYLIPTKLVLLAEALHGVDTFPGVCTLFTGSQLLTPPMITDIMELLPNAQLILYYGASELNYITYAIVDSPYRPPENLGHPFPGVSISIQDGLIYVDTQYHVSGAKIPFSVGDTGSINEKGELIFGGRTGAFVNRGGVKLNLLKLETELQSLPGIREAVALRIKDETRGEGVEVFVVKEADIPEADVRMTIRHGLPNAEMPDKITFVDEMPLNDCGKIDKEKLQ